MSITRTVRSPGWTVIAVFSATLLVMVTVTLTNPPAGRDPRVGATMILPAVTGTVMVYSLTGPPTAVSRKVPLTVLPAAAVSARLAGAASR